MKKILLLLFAVLLSFFCVAEEFSMERFKLALEETNKGGLPVVAVYVRDVEYLPIVRKHILANREFMAQDGKNFRFFLIDMIRFPSFPRGNYNSVCVYHKEPVDNGFFELNSIRPEYYVNEILYRLKPVPKEIKFSYYPHGNIKIFYEKVKKGDFSYHVYNRDGTHIFHYHLKHYFRGLFIPDEIMEDMIRELRKKDLPKDFWSEALMIHTGNIFSYYRDGTGERSIDSWMKITDLLLEAGADPNYADDYGMSTAYMLFHYLSDQWGRAKRVEPFFKKLQSAGLDINRIYPNKRYPEQGFKIRSNNGVFIEKPIPAKGAHPWILNFRYSWDDMMYLIQDWKVDINAGDGYLLKDVIVNFNALYKRIGKSRYELVEELLKMGADPNIRSNEEDATPFLFVCQYLYVDGMLDIFHLMLQYKVNLKLTWVYTDEHFDRHTLNAYTSIKHYKLDNVLREYIDALLDHGFNPDWIDIGAAVGKKDEDLAIYILDRGGYSKNKASYFQRRFPALAERIKQLPPSKIRLESSELKGGWLRDYAVMRPQGTPFEKDVLQHAADLLMKYTDFRSNQRFYFSSSKKLEGVAYPSRGLIGRHRDRIVDESFLVNAVYAQTPDEMEIAYIKTALAMTDWSMDILSGIPYGFPKSYTYGRDHDIIQLKQMAIFDLGVHLRTAAYLYAFLPKHNQTVLDYLPEQTAAFLKDRIDDIPKDLPRKDKEKEIEKILSKLITAYWCGEAPENYDDMVKEIETYWGKTYTIFENELKQLSKYKYKTRKYSKNRGDSGYVPNEIIANPEYSRTHKKPEYSSLEEKIQYYKDSFTGSRVAKKNFAKILDLMLTIPSAKQILEQMPEDLHFYTGAFNTMGAMYHNKQIVLGSVKIDAEDAFTKHPEYIISLIHDLVHEMTHCVQQMNGVNRFKAENQRENMIYHMLTEIHPQINSYLVLRDLLDVPEYKEIALKAIDSNVRVIDHVYKKHYDSANPNLWRNEVVKIFITNGREYPYRDPIRELVESWRSTYERVQFCYFKKDKDGISFEELVAKYELLMETGLGQDYYRNVDPKSVK